jgi:hypothetical protein
VAAGLLPFDQSLRMLLGKGEPDFLEINAQSTEPTTSLVRRKHNKSDQ